MEEHVRAERLAKVAAAGDARRPGSTGGDCRVLDVLRADADEDAPARIGGDPGSRSLDCLVDGDRLPAELDREPLVRRWGTRPLERCSTRSPASRWKASNSGFPADSSCAHRAVRSSEPESRAVKVWAPGRVNLIGEHTDYSGGFALPCAIQLGLTIDVRARDDRLVELTSTLFGAGERFAADGGGPQVAGWARYGQAVAAQLAALGRPAVGMDATVASTLPAGSGLSSSAALEVGLALALCAVAQFSLPPLGVAAACQRAEAQAVGVPCGILDQAACLLGAHDAALLLNCTTLEHSTIPIPEDAAFLILDSGVERRLENTGYAQRRNELDTALEMAGRSNSLELSPSDLTGLDSVSRRRLRHVLTENERVGRFAEALSNEDLSAAGALMTESHRSLRDDYEVSTRELDDLVELACRSGAYGARLVGGGFGGAVLALVDDERAEDVSAAFTDRRRGAEPGLVRASRGAHLLTTALAAAGELTKWSNGPL